MEKNLKRNIYIYTHTHIYIYIYIYIYESLCCTLKLAQHCDSTVLKKKKKKKICADYGYAWKHRATQACVHTVAQKNNPRHKYTGAHTQTHMSLHKHTGVSNIHPFPSSFTGLCNSGLWCVLLCVCWHQIVWWAHQSTSHRARAEAGRHLQPFRTWVLAELLVWELVGLKEGRRPGSRHRPPCSPNPGVNHTCGRPP